MSIADELGIFEYPSYDKIPAAKKAWITMKARRQGKDPKMVHAGIKAKMSRADYKPSKAAPKPGKAKTGETSKRASKDSQERSKAVKKTNMYEASNKQWNPFKGCKFDCLYCETSFKRQAKRQKHICTKCYNYTPHTHPERLNQSIPKTKEGEFIFTFASGDVSFCPTPFLKKVIKVIESKPDRTFLIQSKNPKTFNRVVFPDNVILAITLETDRDEIYKGVSKAPKPSQRYKDFAKIKHSKKMVTIEPVLDFNLVRLTKWIKQIKPFLVWIGYDSSKVNHFGFEEPELAKVKKLKANLEALGIKVKLKTVRQAR